MKTKSLNIFLLDGDSTALRDYQHYLAMQGYDQVHPYARFEEASAAFMHHPDLIVLNCSGNYRQSITWLNKLITYDPKLRVLLLPALRDIGKKQDAQAYLLNLLQNYVAA